jgi:hypothetical protein
MREFFWVILSVLFATSVLRAGDIKYTVNDKVGPGSVTGFITTNGTIGLLNSTDIVNWNLFLNDGTNPTFELKGTTNSGESIGGADLTASATQLLYNFSATDEGNFIIEHPAPGFNGPFVRWSSIAACAPGSPVGVSLSSLMDETFIVSTPLTDTGVIA